MSGLFEKSDALNTPIECFVFDAKNENFPVKPHWHYFAEFIYMLDGCAEMRCGDVSYTLNKGETIIFHPSAVHSIYSADGNFPKYAVLKFDINRLNLTPAYAPKLSGIFQYAEKIGMKILPFDFEETCRYFKKFSAADKALLYGIVGGTPQYLLQVNNKLSVKENIKNIYLNTSSFLFEEPANLLKQEVREPAIYTAVITAIASGASRMSEISTKVGEDTNVCSAYIKNLINLGIVQKENPYGEKNSRKSIYFIEDNMFRFWYRFVLENNSIISRGAAELAYKRIEPHLPNYMGKVFEDICKQYLWKLLIDGKCPVEFNSLGRWWGNDPAQKRQAEIDIMGEQDKNTALFGECKWTNERVDVGVLETLIKRSRIFLYINMHYYLFAKSGFTKGCIDRANEFGNVTLVSYDDIIELFCVK
ncbi:MAG: AraC family ligand binding domain-containing protein [Ruminococcus sp.]|nr:AraC family ligand binding domain-containing protein [Ruminococcus sp.]MCM1480317.1 AraC family ligand binding domain-containing protein [Muribaculaceae bacterium]